MLTNAGMAAGPLGTNPGSDEGGSMGTEDKAKNKAEGALGGAKEKLGDATDDESLQAEGQSEQSKADLKQAGEKVKDAFKD
jgi:uncharacterized protein YjbJ (UPF0337 family)